MWGESQIITRVAVHSINQKGVDSMNRPKRKRRVGVSNINGGKLQMCMQPTVEHHSLMKEEGEKKRYKEQSSSLGDLFKASQRQTPRELHNSQQKNVLNAVQ